MKWILIALLGILHLLSMDAQTKLEVDGSIQVGDHTDPNPNIGTLRWSGSDFEVWNGVIWASLTGDKEVGTVTDIDGNVYKTIRIGDQVWMAENLRVRHYNNGTPILQIEALPDWQDTFDGPGAWCWYNNNPGFDLIYGKLYNGSAAGDDRGICPTGWDVPTIQEVEQLIAFLGGELVSGTKLKAVSEYWNAPNIGATNQSGFSGLPGGARNPSTDFELEGFWGTWWYRRESETTLAYFFRLFNESKGTTLFAGTYVDGRSIRCLKK